MNKPISANFGKGQKMGSLKVTPEQLQTLSGGVSRTSADVRSSHQTLKSQLSPLFGADWSGAAAAQFTTLYDQFDLHAKGLSDALDGIGQLLNRAGSTYADAEQQIASSFR
jgi:WXG100 family type VII secretion target